ncbi:MAG: putative polysaccharide biosynthesis protein [Sarcina sp.]
MMMKEQSTTKSFAILTIAGILAKLMSLLYVPILTRILGREGMGMYFKVYDIFVFIYAVTNVGMQTAISKYIAELSAVGNYKDAVRTFKISRSFLFLVGTICTVIMMFGSNFIANATGNPEIAYGLMFLSPAILTTSILATYKGYFQGRNQMKPVALASIFEQFANVIFSIFFASILIKFGSKLGSAGGTIGTSVGAVIAVIYLMYIYYVFKPEKEASIKQERDVKRIRTKKIIKILISYGLPITLSSGLQNFGNVIDMANVNSRLLVAGFDEIQANIMYGLLGQWRTLINIPMVFVTSLCVALLPALSKAHVLKDKLSLKKNIRFALRTTYILSIPAAVGLAALSREVYKYMYGDEIGHQMMILGSVTIVLMAIVFVQNIVLQSVNNFYFVIYTLIIGLVIKFIANYILVANEVINIYGAVIGFILYFSIVLVLNNKKIVSVTKININHSKLIVKPILASLYMTIGIVLVRSILSLFVDVYSFTTIVGLTYTSLLVIIGVIFYLHALIYLKAISADDIKSASPRLYNKIPLRIKNKLQ